jgi:hypothetical protein
MKSFLIGDSGPEQHLLLFFFPLKLMKVPKGNPYHSATSGEMAIYRANSLILRKVRFL